MKIILRVVLWLVPAFLAFGPSTLACSFPPPETFSVPSVFVRGMAGLPPALPLDPISIPERFS